MPYNGAGTYSPPAADFPAVSLTLIQATKFNNILNDVATALSTAITKDGQTTVTANIPMAGFALTNARLRAIDGLVGTPGITFENDVDCGWYRIGANNLGFALNGAKVADWATTSLTLSAHLLFSVDNTYDIGASGATRARDFFLGRNATIGGTADVAGNFSVATNKFTVAASTGNTVVAGTLGVTGIVTLTSSGGSGLRVYGSTGTHQWDVYLSGTNLRLSDNTGSGSLQLDTGLLTTGGATNFDFSTSGGTQVRIAHTASVTRYITLTGSNGGNPTIDVSAGSLAITPALVLASTLTTSSNITANSATQRLLLGTTTGNGGITNSTVDASILLYGHTHATKADQVDVTSPQTNFSGIVTVSSPATTQSVGTLAIGQGTQTTVGAAGGASAQPATPLGYLLFYIGGTKVAVPYHTA